MFRVFQPTDFAEGRTDSLLNHFATVCPDDRIVASLKNEERMVQAWEPLPDFSLEPDELHPGFEGIDGIALPRHLVLVAGTLGSMRDKRRGEDEAQMIPVRKSQTQRRSVANHRRQFRMLAGEVQGQHRSSRFACNRKAPTRLGQRCISLFDRLNPLLAGGEIEVVRRGTVSGQQWSHHAITSVPEVCCQWSYLGGGRGQAVEQKNTKFSVPPIEGPPLKLGVDQRPFQGFQNKRWPTGILL